ncbi:MAG: DUF928 domain-containing protein [Prochloraceae cyanobacterium]|nr:DUF928 domain-containing protein [Prochloraceae cyanobacterium]
MKKFLAIPLIVLAYLGFTSYSPGISSENKNSIFKNGVPRSKPTTETDRGAGSRSDCQYPINSDLVAFAPPDGEVAKTIKSHPTFSIYLQEVPGGPLRYAWIDAKTRETLTYQKFEVTTKGIVTLSIPENLPEMKLDRDYVLIVGIVCRENYTLTDIGKRLWVRRVSEPPSLSQARNDQERLTTLKDENIWYDAIVAAFQNRDSASDERGTTISELLKQYNLYDQAFLSADISALDWETTKTESLKINN